MNATSPALRGVRRRRPRAFTLIELLVVIAVIAILAGITMKMTVYVNNKLGRARAIRDLHQIKNALAEYHSTFGIYPPIEPSTNPSPWISSYMAYVYQNSLPAATVPTLGYNTGLVYYLTVIPEASRWSQFLVGVMPNIGCDGPHSNMVGGFGWAFWTNNGATCVDPWGTEYNYSTSAPGGSSGWQSYRLWSSGPDGSSDAAHTNDDIGVRWDE